MNHIAVSIMLAGTVLGAHSANAATFFEGNSAAIDNKVHAFSDISHPDNGTSVFGITDAENELVKYTSTETIQITSGSGYAQISDGSGPESWDNVTIALDSNPFGFTGIEFAISFLNSDVSNSDKGILTVTANFLDPLASSQIFTVNDFKNPANRSFYLLADSGEVFKSISLSSGVDRFSQLKQTDLLLAQTGAVPEPATWAMMIVGFGVVGASMRRRKARVSYAMA